MDKTRVTGEPRVPKRKKRGTVLKRKLQQLKELAISPASCDWLRTTPLLRGPMRHPTIETDLAGPHNIIQLPTRAARRASPNPRSTVPPNTAQDGCPKAGVSTPVRLRPRSLLQLAAAAAKLTRKSTAAPGQRTDSVGRAQHGLTPGRCRTRSFNQHVLYDTTPLPDSIPKVKEIGASSAPLLSAAFFIGARCRDYNDDFMQCKNENPGTGEAKCLTEGRRVTRCARSVLEDINKSCLDEFRKHWQCLDNNNHQLWQCRADEWKLNKCVYDNIVRIVRPCAATSWYGSLIQSLIGSPLRVWRRPFPTSPRTRPRSTSAESRYSPTIPSCQTRSHLSRKRRTLRPIHHRHRDLRPCLCSGWWEESWLRSVGARGQGVT